MEALKSILSPFAMNSGGLQDTLVCLYRHICALLLISFDQKLVVIGGTVETARRASMSAWNGFVDCMSFVVWYLLITKAYRVSSFFSHCPFQLS
jgi:hypothetical protein